ncbi:MAG: DUF1636 domain-containing protein [Cyanobacteriota bacterium]|nr:DUF1636 domain-containing protein [Cyanobacteriota bacterium]
MSESSPQQTPQHTLFVCTTCATTWENGKRVRCGGEQFLQQLQILHQNWEFKEKFSLKSVRCMSACDRACVFSLAASGKHTYLFGDVPTQTEIVLKTSEAVLECAERYYADSEGLLPWVERPQLLRKKVVAHIPPVSMRSPSATPTTPPPSTTPTTLNGRSLATHN